MLAINPGAGPVVDSTLAEAECDIAAFIADLELGVIKATRCPRLDKGGRFGFTLRLDERTVSVEMPGKPIEQVRYVDSDKQNIWDFPRLYVDGSSWVWKYAVGIAKDTLLGIED